MAGQVEGRGTERRRITQKCWLGLETGWGGGHRGHPEMAGFRGRGAVREQTSEENQVSPRSVCGIWRKVMHGLKSPTRSWKPETEMEAKL